MTAERHTVRPAAAETWAGRALVAAIVAAYVLVVGGVTLWAVAALVGGPGGPPTAVAWCLASFATAATLPPSYLWIRSGVDELLATPPTPEASPFAVVPDQLDGPPEVLTAMAATIRDALDVPAAAIDVRALPDGPAERGPWAAGASVTAGTMTASAIEVPIVHAGRSYGTVRVAARGRSARTGTANQLLVDLARQVALVVSSEVLREEVEASRARLVLAREEERRRIRRNLHDGLGPSLAAIRLQVAALRRELEADGRGAAALDDIRDGVGAATDEVRRVVDDLRPPLLDDCGLVDAVRNLRIVPPELRLEVDAPAPMPQLPAAVEVALYRIAVEAVHNTVRHAMATRCVVELRVSEHEATLVVTDDGCGPPIPARPGVGTATMTERATELGGTLTIEPAPGGGTRVAAALPLRRGAAT